MSNTILNTVALFNTLEDINNKMAPDAPGKKELNTLLKTIAVAMESDAEYEMEQETNFGVMRSWYK